MKKVIISIVVCIAIVITFVCSFNFLLNLKEEKDAEARQNIRQKQQELERKKMEVVRIDFKTAVDLVERQKITKSCCHLFDFEKQRDLVDPNILVGVEIRRGMLEDILNDKIKLFWVVELKSSDPKNFDEYVLTEIFVGGDYDEGFERVLVKKNYNCNDNVDGFDYFDPIRLVGKNYQVLGFNLNEEVRHIEEGDVTFPTGKTVKLCKWEEE